MVFERTLFRVHERFLSLEAVRKSVDYCYKGAILIGTLPSLPSISLNPVKSINLPANLFVRKLSLSRTKRLSTAAY